MAENQHIVIIGCGAGGGAAAQFARKTNRKAQITIFEKSNYPYYSKCGLPYAIQERIPHFQNLIEYPKEWFDKEHITLHLNTTVTNINHKTKTLTATHNNKTIKTTYDTLIIATGAIPWIPQIHNISSKNNLPKGIHTLRTIPDGQKIKQDIQPKKHATIIGAGLIGLELADALTHKNMQVTVIEALPHILANTLDPDMAKIVHTFLSEKITIKTNHLLEKINTKNNEISSIQIKNNETNEPITLDTTLLVIATGTRPETQLAQDIGCKIGPTKGIIVDNTTKTSVPNVYAVGDCTEYLDLQTKKPTLIGLGSIVLRQGIAAGINAAGGNYELHPGVLLTRTSEFFDLEIAAVGPVTTAYENKKLIQGRFNGSSLPEYFPGGQPITMKIGVEPDSGRIFNAQAVGSNAAQRINVYASALLKHMTVEDFRRLETAYAPPIAPTLDVLTLTADVAALKQKRQRKT